MFTFNRKKRKIRSFFPYKLGRVQYLTNISIKNKYMYVETPKVACSTIKRCLYTIDGYKKFSSCVDVHNKDKSPLLGLLDIEDIDNILLGEKYFRFSFVRNPYTRILSAYLDKIQRKHPKRDFFLKKAGFRAGENVNFLDFLTSIRDISNYEKDIHWSPQSYILQVENINYHFIGRFEKIDRDLKYIITKISGNTNIFEGTAIREDRHKTNASERLKNYIGKRERELIMEIYDKDFSLFGYSLDPDLAIKY